MLLSELATSDIAILGAGREGRSVRNWLKRHLPDKPVHIYEEQAIVPEWLDVPGDRIINGPFDVEVMAKHDVFIRSPGISPYREDLTRLRQSGKPFTSGSSIWFAQNPDAKTICITGTKGKSTTAALVTHLLRSTGLSVHLAGNIGQPLLDFDSAADWWVIELSSYQLTDLKAQPTVAAILNLSDEHLDWHGDSRSYRNDKMKMAELSEDSVLVSNHTDESLRALTRRRDNILWFGAPSGFHVSGNQLLQQDETIEDIPRQFLPGPHNLMNLAAALTITHAAGVDVDDPATALESFAGLPHRLEHLGQNDGVSFVNDSLSTTPVATVAALEAFEGQSVILLVGGMDRGVDWRPLIPEISRFEPKAIICLPDSGPDIARVMKDSGLQSVCEIYCAENLRDAMQYARNMSNAGDTILLSPGAPSFPHFKDFEDRGQQFTELANLE